MEEGPNKILGKYTFPKKVGIVFLERRKRLGANKHEFPFKIASDEISLDFDQNACAFFLLQMNHHQNIFEFQVVDIPKENDKEFQIPIKDSKENLFEWVDRFGSKHSNLGVNYWMGITSELIRERPTSHFYRRKAEVTKSSRIVWIITSKDWDALWAPPSVFEYLSATVFRCALESLSIELQDEELKEMEFLRHKGHKVTRGCIFDFTHRRNSVSIFKLCSGCKQKLSSLEQLIKEKGDDIKLVDDVTTILSKKWMGTPEKRDSPIYDLKRIYKYDVDRNSGYNKGLREKFRDSIYDKSAEWIVSGIIGATITGAIAIVFRLIG